MARMRVAAWMPAAVAGAALALLTLYLMPWAFDQLNQANDAAVAQGRTTTLLVVGAWLVWLGWLWRTWGKGESQCNGE